MHTNSHQEEQESVHNAVDTYSSNALPSPKHSSAEQESSNSKEPIKYINLVLQGGGTLGIAHVGAIKALEDKGYRFKRVAGTSAGAIVALLLAAARESIDNRCSHKLREILWDLPASEFVDGPYRIRRLIRKLIPFEGIKLDSALLLPEIYYAIRMLTLSGGLNSGDAFKRWLESVLRDQFSINTIEDLQRRVENSIPNTTADETDWRKYFSLITTALPIGLKLEFPKHLQYLNINAATESPALLVRASMSVPAFFTPLVVPTGKTWKEFIDDEEIEQARGRHVANDAKQLSRVLLFDGGVLSNLPIDAFDATQPQESESIPTFGISLHSSNDTVLQQYQGIKGVIQSASQLLGAARSIRDAEARRRKKRDSKLISINTGKHNWLNFSLTDLETDDLFKRGYNTVIKSLPTSPVK